VDELAAAIPGVLEASAVPGAEALREALGQRPPGEASDAVLELVRSVALPPRSGR
jgi:hypothetical protein